MNSRAIVDLSTKISDILNSEMRFEMKLLNFEANFVELFFCCASQGGKEYDAGSSRR